MNEVPSLSVIVPALNAASHIEDCINSIINQEYPQAFEVIVALGQSSDDTSQILQQLALRHPQIRIIENPAGTTPAALNKSIKASSGEVIARVDTQSILPAEYLKHSVEILRHTGAANVGGKQVPIGNEGTQRIIALAMQSPFGTGTASFRSSKQEGSVDTVYLGTFSREALIKVGGFNEFFIRNQDYELNWRLREAGFTIWFEPKLEVAYLPRSTFKGLASQYLQYGLWKRRMLLKYPRSLKLRHLVAPSLVLGLLGSLIMIGFGSLLGFIIPVLYFFSLIFSSLREKRIRKLTHRSQLILAFTTMHLSWGLGFFLPNRKITTTNQNQK